MKTARQEAFEILNKIQRDKAYSNLALDSAFEKSSLNVKDKRLAGAIVYGVIERKLTLDYQLKAYLSQPLKKLKPQVLTALRMGAYQLLFMDKIPAAAAVNESVKLAKNNSMAFAAGLINAVLHKIEKNGLILPDEEDAEYLSVKYSCADWLCRLWTESYGSENAKALLNASFGSLENYIRVNALKTDAHKLKKLLADEGIEAEPLKEMPNALKVLSSGALHKTECYRHGLFHVQDLASQLCCQALGVREEETVLDVCAAPGGKKLYACPNDE